MRVVDMVMMIDLDYEIVGYVGHTLMRMAGSRLR